MSDHLLIADDDPSLRELLGDYLGRNGFRVSGAADGRGLWAALDQEPVDLIILDLIPARRRLSNYLLASAHRVAGGCAVTGEISGGSR